MAASILMTIPLELRRQIYETALPHETRVNCCTCNNTIDGRPFRLRDQSKQLFRLICRQANRELRSLRPSVVAAFCDQRCMTAWFHGPGRGTTRKLIQVNVVEFEQNAGISTRISAAQLFINASIFDPGPLLKGRDEARNRVIDQSLLVLGHYFRSLQLISAHWRIYPQHDGVIVRFGVGDVIH